MKRVFACFVVILCAATILAEKVTVSWTHSPNILQFPQPQGYGIVYGYASKNYTYTNVVGYVTNCVISNLMSGKTAYFAAYAWADGGKTTSELTPEISYNIPIRGPSNLRIIDWK